MAEGRSSTICGRCGSRVHDGDEFCGACGAKVSSDTQATAQQEIPPQIRAPRLVSTRSDGRRRISAVAIGALLVLLAGTGAVAYAVLGSGTNLLGWTGFQPSDAEEATPTQEEPTEETSPGSPSTMASVSPDSPPDPAFDKLLPELERRTENVNLLLPAELPSTLDNVAIDPNLQGDRYGIAFFREPQENVLKSGGRAEIYGTLRAAPAEEEVSNEYFEATSVENIELPDGAEATLRRMEPVQERRGTQGPFWDGKFEEGNHAYTLILLDDTSRDMAAQVLSTIVEVPRQRGHEATTPRVPPSKASASEAEEAAKDYYLKAGSKDWEYTYDHLDLQTRRLFTKEEWSQKNQWLADNNPMIYRIDSVDLENASQESVAEVAVSLTGEDGSTSIRNTYFVLEDGSWKHRFSQEEKDLFMPGVPFEEFVEARQGAPS